MLIFAFPSLFSAFGQALRSVSARACMSGEESSHCATSPPPVVQLAVLQCPSEANAVLLSELLLEAGALYVSLSDADAGTEAEVPLFGVHPSEAPDGAMVLTDVPDKAGSLRAADVYDPHRMETWDELMRARRLWSNAVLEVGFAADADVEAALLLCAASAELELPRFTIEQLGARDWVSEVQANWPPVVLPGCLLIRFPWHSEEDVTTLGETVPAASLTLHPGMAFGTGEHATTQLCCAALLETDLKGRTVLDYGSGSGVLALAALLFGAARAVGVEIDREAISISEMNAKENGVQERYDALLPETEAARGATYPLVIANILAGTLVELQPLLTHRVAPGGTLLMSGIWGEQQAAKVLAAYEGEIDFGPATYQDGWALLKGTRPSLS